MNPDR